MRDPKRIDKILDTIKEIWVKSPDLRLCQLLGNALQKTDTFSYITDTEFYYLEDDILLQRLKDRYFKNQDNNNDAKVSTQELITTLVDKSVGLSALGTRLSATKTIQHSTMIDLDDISCTEDEFNKKVLNIFDKIVSNDLMLGIHIREDLEQLKKLQKEIETNRKMRLMR